MKKCIIACMLVSLCSVPGFVNAEDVIQNPTNETAQTTTVPQKVLKASERAKYDNLCNKANALIDKKQYDQANALIQKAMTISSDLDMAYAIKSRLLQKQNQDNSEAEVYARKALNINSKNYIANNVLGNVYYLNKEAQNALTYYKKSIESKVDYFPPYLNIASLYKWDIPDLKQAAEYYSKAIQYATKEDFKDLQNPYIQRADVYNQLQQYDLAVKDTDVALTLNKNNYYAYNLKGRIYANQGNFKDAIKYANKAVKMAEGKNDVEVYLTRIYIYSKMNYDYTMVSSDFCKAEVLAGKDVKKLLRMLAYLNEFKKPDESVRICRKILEIEPNNKLALNMYAVSLMNNGDYSNAKLIMGKINYDELSAKDKASYTFNLALINAGIAGLNDKNTLNQALSGFQKSLSLDSTRYNEYYNIGNCYFINGDYKNAYNNYNKYLEREKQKTGSYTFGGVYKYLLLQELTSYNNYETRNGKKYQVWGAPNWIFSNKNLDSFDWDSIKDSINNDLAGRINYSNGVSRIDDKNYILNTINMLNTRTGNIGKTYNMHINNESYGNTSRVFVYPFVDAIDTPATTVSVNDYNLLCANQYFLLIRNSVGSSPQVYSVNQSDVENFFYAINNIQKNTAANLIDDLLEYSYGDGDLFNNMSLSMSFYNKAISYLKNNCLDKRTANTKQHIKNAYLSMGDYYRQQGNIDTAINYYNYAIPYGMSQHKVNSFIGDYYFDSKNFFKANEYYSKALIAKADADVFLSRGQARTHMNDYDGAVADFTKAIGYNKNLAQAYWERGQVLFKQKKYSIALNDYIKYSSMDKDEPASQYNAGICLYNTGKKQAALPYFERAKNISQRIGNQDMYNSCVRMINDVKGYNRGWY